MTRFSLLALAALAGTALALPAQQAFLGSQLSSTRVPSLNSFQLTDQDRQQLQAHILAHPEPRWVRLADGGDPVSLTEGEKALLSLGRTRFEDVSDEVLNGKTWATQSLSKEYPAKLGHNATELAKAFELIDVQEMESERPRLRMASGPPGGDPASLTSAPLIARAPDAVHRVLQPVLHVQDRQGEPAVAPQLP